MKVLRNQKHEDGRLVLIEHNGPFYLIDYVSKSVGLTLAVATSKEDAYKIFENELRTKMLIKKYNLYV